MKLFGKCVNKVAKVQVNLVLGIIVPFHLHCTTREETMESNALKYVHVSDSKELKTVYVLIVKHKLTSEEQKQGRELQEF